MHHYKRSELVQALQAVGLESGGAAFFHVSLGMLGLAEGCQDMSAVNAMFLDALGEVLGPDGTIVVPTYTYSFGKGECFDPDITPSVVGPFTEYFRVQPGVLRSHDPMLSVAARGPLAELLLRDLPHTCYGPGSVYARLVAHKVKICTVGLGLHWATFLHHIEELAAVPFRYKKVFVGQIRRKGRENTEAWVYSVRILADNGIPDGRKMEAMAQKNDLCRLARVGRGQVCSINSEKYLDFGLQALSGEPWLSARGPAGDPLKLERLRVGGKTQFGRPDAEDMDNILTELGSVPSQMAYEVADKLLNQLSREHSFVLHPYRTGEEHFGWVVPERWSLTSCSIVSKDISEALDAHLGEVEVLPYSCSVEVDLSRHEMMNRIKGQENVWDQTGTGDLVTTCQSYVRDWCVRIRPDLVTVVKADSYRISLHSAFFYADLHVAEALVPGKEKDAILILTKYISQCGIEVCEMIRELLHALAKIEGQGQHKYSYRFVLVPDWPCTCSYLQTIQEIPLVGIVVGKYKKQKQWIAKHLQSICLKEDQNIVEMIRKLTAVNIDDINNCQSDSLIISGQNIAPGKATAENASENCIYIDWHLENSIQWIDRNINMKY